MIIPPVCVGIDVSKHTLDVFREGSGPGSGYSRIANEAQAVAGLVAGFGADCLVVLEATGHYDAVLRKALERAGVAFARINPEQARHFAKAIGRLAKTDRVDARMLAEFGRRLAPKPEPSADPAREALALLHKRRDQLVAMRQQERVRLRECAHAGLGEGLVENCLEKGLDDGLARHVAWLDAEIAAIEAQIAGLVGRSPALREAGERLRTIPGIGPVTAATLLALMPELGARQPKPLAALAGLAPFNVDSGRSQGHRCIKKGRARVRRALYMAALSAAQGKSRLAQKYRTLREAGKPPKLALVAIARKILTIANAVLRDQTSFNHA